MQPGMAPQISTAEDQLGTVKSATFTVHHPKLYQKPGAEDQPSRWDACSARVAGPDKSIFVYETVLQSPEHALALSQALAMASAWIRNNS